MELDMRIKIEIGKILKYSIDDIYYMDFKNIIKKTKYKNEDILMYLIQKFEQELSKEQLANVINKIIQSIGIIVGCSADEFIRFNKETIQKIYGLANKCKEKTDEEITTKVIEVLEETLRCCYPQIKYNKEESKIEELSSELIKQLEENLKATEAKILELEKTIDKLKNKINSQNKAYDKLKEQKIQLGELKSKLETEIQDLKRSINNQDVDKQVLNDKIKNLNTKLENSKREIESYQKQIGNLQNLLEKQQQDYNKKIQSLETVNKGLTKQIHNTQQQQENQKEKAKKIRLMNNLIITELYLNPRVDINSIILKAKEKSIYFDYPEIHKLLGELKKTTNIEGPLFDTFPPSYRFNKSAPIIEKPFYYAVGENVKEIDILLYSDTHIDCTTTLDSLRRQSDMLYNYSAKNNIGIIFHLGDIYELYHHLHTKNLDNFKLVKELINKFIISIPKNTGIYQGFLGGNHDKEILAFGIEPLAKMANQREDLINLGYSHRKIQLGNIHNQLLLHHPERRFQEDILFSKELQDYLNGFYSCHENREDTYCDLIGHTHRGKLDTINSYCMVPSLTRDRAKNGCWHLKVYFDENQDISYMTFIPLIIENQRLRPISEIPYKKIRKIK